MGLGINVTLSPPLWFLTHTHMLLSSNPLPTNLISGMSHAEPSADTGAQRDSCAPPPIFHTLQPSVTPGDLFRLLLPTNAGPLKAAMDDAGGQGAVWKRKQWKLGWKDILYLSVPIIPWQWRSTPEVLGIGRCGRWACVLACMSLPGIQIACNKAWLSYVLQESGY